MTNQTKKVPKAVALISGGLDSMLAAKIIADQGVQVEGLNFYTGFCHSGHTSAIRGSRGKVKRNDALWSAKQVGIPLHIIDVVEPYKEVVQNPKHGYGKHMNPCLDCKIFMVDRAKQWMIEHDFDFIITGEVLGQRPKSQTKRSVNIVSQTNQIADRLLRPLSAKYFPPTLPELNGWVDREKLYDFTGRNRTPQIELAKSLGLIDFAQPAGGCCVLTDLRYSSKLSDFWEHRESKSYEIDDIILLKVGRHLRPSERFKMIIGRNEGENNFLEGFRKRFLHVRPVDCLGPLMLIEGKPNEEDLTLALQTFGRYCKLEGKEQVEVLLMDKDSKVKQEKITPLKTTEVLEEWYV